MKNNNINLIMENYDTFSIYFIFITSFFGISFYLFTFLFLVFMFKKKNLILNSNFSCFFIHCLTNLFDIIIEKNFYEEVDNTKNTIPNFNDITVNFNYKEKYKTPEIILYFLYLIQYYFIIKQIDKYTSGEKIFDCDIDFSFNYLWIFHIFYIFILFPYNIITSEIEGPIKYIRIIFLLAFVISFYIVLDSRIKDLMEFFLEKSDSHDSDLTIHIQTMRPIHLYEMYKKIHNLIFINFVIFIMISTLKLMLAIVDKNSSLETFMKDIIVILDDSIYFIMFYFLTFVLYLLNKEYEPENKRVSNHDIVDLEEKEEEDEEENEEENEEDNEEEEDEKEKENDKENKDEKDFEEEEEKETEYTEKKNFSQETDKINVINNEQNVEMIKIKNKKKKRPETYKNYEDDKIDIYN